jgi:hypothetical protein
MPDPLDELKNLEGAASRARLSPEEVRRRGDRMRRRRGALQAVAAAAVAGVVFSGGALAFGGLQGTAPQPAPAPSHPSPTPSDEADEVEWVTTVPDDLGQALFDSLPVEDAEGAPTFTHAGLAVPWKGLPCGEVDETSVYPVMGSSWFDGVDDARTDQRFSAVAPPAAMASRQLVVYPDAETATAAVEAVRDQTEACGPLEAVPGASEFRWSAAAHSFGGHDGLLLSGAEYVVGTDERTIGRTLVGLVREGNAVLTVLHGDESSAPVEDLDEPDARELVELTGDFADRMCVFAADPCVEPEPEQTADLDEGALLDLQDVESLAAGLDTDWAQVEDREDPTIDCQADWLSSLEPSGMVFREFSGTGAPGVVNAEAATAVLSFGDTAQAEDAFATVSRWVTDCEDRMDGTRPVSIAHTPVRDRTEHGPSLWRVVESPAPEVCSECDTGWIDAQGVALVGDRVAVLSIAYIGTMMTGEDASASPMADGIGLLADRVAESLGAVPAAESFGPEGMRGVELGVSARTGPAAKRIDVVGTSGPGCEAFRVAGPGEPSSNIDGFAEEDRGVAVLFARPAMTTPAGVGLGSTRAEVRAAHPDGEDLVPGYRVPVPGHPDRWYQFAFHQDGTVESLVLALDGQTCIG